MKNDKLIIIGILGLCLGLRLVLITQSFWLDEAAQALESVRPLSQQLHLREDFQPPLYHVLVHVLAGVNRSEWWLRLASLLPALMTVWATINLGIKLGQRRAGYVAGILLATSQFHVFYSQELRPYSLAAMWGVLSLSRLMLMNRTRKFDWGYALYTTAGMYTVYTFIFWVAAQALMVVALHRRILVPYLKSLALSLILFLPWTPSLLEQLRVGVALKTTLPAWGAVVSPPALKALFLVPAKFIFGRIDVPGDRVALFGLGCILIVLGFAVIKNLRQRAYAVLYGTLGIPVLLGALVSLWLPVLDPKRFLFCLPVLYLLLAAGIQKVKYSWLWVCALLLLNSLTLFLYWTRPAYQREPWRAAVSQIEAVTPPTAPVIFPFTGPYAPWEWYGSGTHPKVAFESLPVTIQQLHPKLVSIAGTPTVILFDYLIDISDPGRWIVSELYSRGYGETGYYQYPGIGKIRIFSRTPVYALQ